MQYAAEITQPTPEGTSNGLIQLCGQVSVVFVYVMAALKARTARSRCRCFWSAGLLAACALILSRLKDAPLSARGPAAATTVAVPSREELGATVTAPSAGD